MEAEICLLSVTTENLALLELILAALFLLASLFFFMKTFRFYREETSKKRWKEAEEAEQRLRRKEEHREKKTDRFAGPPSDEEETMAEGPEWGETVISPRDGESDETQVMDSGEPVWLEYMEAGRKKRFFITREVTRIGRQKDQVDLPVDNNKVGKIHAQLIQEKGKFYVRDMNSKNGTYLNGSGRRIAEDILTPVSDGDKITLADSEFIFRRGWKD